MGLVMNRRQTGLALAGLSIFGFMLTAAGAMVGIHRPSRTAIVHPELTAAPAQTLPGAALPGPPPPAPGPYAYIQGQVSETQRWQQVYAEGDALYRSGKYDEAYKRWADCLCLAEQEDALNSGNGIEQIDLLQKLAIVYKTQQKPEAAADCYQRAVTIASKAYGKDDPRVALLMLDLGRMYTFYDGIKSYPKATEILEQAFRINERAYGKFTIPTGDVAIALAQLKQNEGQYAKAAEYFSLAIEIGNRLEPGIVSCCRIGPRQGLAASYEKMNKLDDALAVHRELIAMCKTGATNMMPTVVSGCASCLQKMGRNDEAAKLLLSVNK